MDLIEDIGPILGIVAFLGFAILALLIVLQAREVRRLREWAGRAPERADDAEAAGDAIAEAEGSDEDDSPGLLARTRARVAGAVGPRWEQLDRRSPVDPRWVLAVIAVVAIAAGVVTGGFGLGTDDAPPEQAEDGERPAREPKTEVAVLNATQVEVPVPVPPVPGAADLVAREVVRPAGFAIGVRTDALAGEETSVIMFEPDAEEEAQELAGEVEPELGQTRVEPMADDVRAQSDGAPVALLVGADDAEFGQDPEGAVAP